MATCSYSKLVGGACGPSVSNPANVECALIGECGKDIQGHLKLTNVRTLPWMKQGYSWPEQVSVFFCCNSVSDLWRQNIE